eukprot:COSAG06_NODE_544_length_14458_cov_18.391671_3_plen_55_part_00
MAFRCSDAVLISPTFIRPKPDRTKKHITQIEEIICPHHRHQTIRTPCQAGATSS